MCEKTILETGGMLGFITDCLNNEKKYDKAVVNYSLALRFLPIFYRTQKMCNEAVSTYPSAVKFLPEW